MLFIIWIVLSIKQIRCNHLFPTFLNGVEESSDIWNTIRNFKKGVSTLITAASGTGKTTLLEILISHQMNFSGQLHYDDKNSTDLDDNEIQDLRLRSLSTVFQNLEVFDELTGMENIQLQATTTTREIFDMAELLGVSHCLSRKCSHISYGQKQRLAIIRAVARPFDFLILDEPFSNLDEENIKKASDLIINTVTKNHAGLIFLSLGDDYGIKFDEKLEL